MDLEPKEKFDKKLMTQNEISWARGQEAMRLKIFDEKSQESGWVRLVPFTVLQSV